MSETETKLRLAVGSLIDIVFELAVALEQGDKPDSAFIDLVAETLRKHKQDLGFEL